MLWVKELVAVAFRDDDYFFSFWLALVTARVYNLTKSIYNVVMDKHISNSNLVSAFGTNLSSYIYIYISVALCSATLLSGLILASSTVSADDSVVDQMNITVPVSCTMSGTGMNTHNADITNGTYTADIGTTTLHAFCNDAEGFAIYATGYTGNEIGGTNSNKLVGTSASSNATIDTGLATSAGSPDVSNWAMKLTMAQDSGDTTGTNAFTIDSAPNVSGGADASFSDYHVVPNEYTKVAHKNSGTDMAANTGGVKLTTTYAAYISKTQPADTYSGQVKYTLVHPASHVTPTEPIACPAGYICYAPNANDVTGNMNVLGASQDTTTGTGQAYAGDPDSIIGYQEVDSYYLNSDAHLASPNFKRVGYGFAGWNTDPNGNGTMYGPNQDFTPGDISTEGVAMYAQWVSSSGNLQGWTGCSTLPQGKVIALTDTRDNNTYAISKLADGKCWMIENLRLDNSMTGTISSANTDNPISSFTSLTASSDSWCTQNTSACINQIVLNNNNTNIGGTNASGTALVPGPNKWMSSSNKAEWYSYGNYYNWYTATAGNGTYSISTNGQNVEGSICPNGWTLPVANSLAVADENNTDFMNLTYALSGLKNYSYDSSTNPTGAQVSNMLRSYPNNFTYSGLWNGSSANSRGYNGYYWSRSASSSNYAYYLYLTSTYVYPSNFGSSKFNGPSVRCLASGS